VLDVLDLQVMHGKEFGGEAFMTKPAVVEFRDFEVGMVIS
jgi:hypothetical protein